MSTNEVSLCSLYYLNFLVLWKNNKMTKTLSIFLRNMKRHHHPPTSILSQLWLWQKWMLRLLKKTKRKWSNCKKEFPRCLKAFSGKNYIPCVYFRRRAKLFRYIIGQHDTAPEWKERGIGDVKILKNRAKPSYRLVMRREKTLKVCANHLCKSLNVHRWKIVTWLTWHGGIWNCTWGVPRHPRNMSASLKNVVMSKQEYTPQPKRILLPPTCPSWLRIPLSKNTPTPTLHLFSLISSPIFFDSVTKDMELKPNCGSDRAWVWTVAADYADEEPKNETLAIRFGNAESMYTP